MYLILLLPVKTRQKVTTVHVLQCQISGQDVLATPLQENQRNLLSQVSVAFQRLDMEKSESG